MKIFYQCTDFFFRSCILPILRRFAFCLHFDWGPEGQKLDERTSAGRSRSPPRDWQRNAAEIIISVCRISVPRFGFGIRWDLSVGGGHMCG